MIYAGSASGETKNVPTSKAERAAFVLNDAEILDLARRPPRSRTHYGQPMDMEWARDGDTGELFIVQARPETVQSRADAGRDQVLHGHEGREAAAEGPQRRVRRGHRPRLPDRMRADIDQFVDGSILVTSTTDPDWVPIMKRASAIVTDHGGRTSHAAIVSRELGLPAIVGTGNATARPA